MVEIKKNSIVLRNAKILFKNFSGNASDYNDAGRRNFNVLIENEEDFNALVAAGMPVSHHEAVQKIDRDGNAYTRPAYNVMKVNVSFMYKAPAVYRVKNGTPEALTEETVNGLDYDTIVSADLNLSTSNWTHAGRSGVSLYLNVGYFNVVDEDPFAEFYQNQDNLF